MPSSATLIIDSVAGTCFNKTTISTGFSFLPEVGFNPTRNFQRAASSGALDHRNAFEYKPFKFMDFKEFYLPDRTIYVKPSPFSPAYSTFMNPSE
jgi:hypothetical protein